MLDRGYLRVARPWGVEVRIHWSVPLAALLAARLRFEPALWLGFLGVVLVHQLGHALGVALCGGRLLGLDTTGLGGSCRWRGAGTLLERAWVAWAGILAQGVLLGAALALSAGRVAQGTEASLRYCFVELNLAVLAINLLPVAPLDGALLWRLFGALRASAWTPRQALLGWARRHRERRAEGPGGSLSAEEQPAPSSGTALSSGLSVPVARSPGAPPTDLPFTRVRGRGAPHSQRGDRAATEDVPEDEQLQSPRPSEQAQREIDALLRRVEDRVARSRRGR
jgi:stage IV sporulation protein FB